jgi:6,7-dimethyl-8-ribityllumazine synthase
MATSDQNLSQFDLSKLGDCSGLRIGMVTADWNSDVTYKLRDGAVATLKEAGVTDNHIHSIQVPGSFELIAGARLLASRENLDAVICIGCVIKGETPHFEVINHAVATGIAELNVISGLPFIFGVLTTDNQEQAIERAGGRHGNKGSEAAYTALKMGLMKRDLGKSPSGVGFKN